MAELVDAHDSKSCGSNVMGVRFPPSALIQLSVNSYELTVKDDFFNYWGGAVLVFKLAEVKG